MSEIAGKYQSRPLKLGAAPHMESLLRLDFARRFTCALLESKNQIDFSTSFPVLFAPKIEKFLAFLWYYFFGWMGWQSRLLEKQASP